MKPFAFLSMFSFEKYPLENVIKSYCLDVQDFFKSGDKNREIVRIIIKFSDFSSENEVKFLVYF